jgi:hypothetical protein
MRPSLLSCIIGLLLGLGVPRVILAQPLSAPAVNRAIRAAANELLGRIEPDGQVRCQLIDFADGGAEGMVAMAALAGGVPEKHWALRRLLSTLFEETPTRTLARSLRVRVTLQLESFRRDVLRRDVQALLASQQPDGGWGPTADEPSDVIHTALAVTALGEAKKVGLTDSTQAFDKARGYLLRVRNEDGGFGYRPASETVRPLRASSHAMTTAAAIAALQTILGNTPSHPAGLPPAGFRELQQARQVLLASQPINGGGWLWGQRPVHLAAWWLSEAAAGAGDRFNLLGRDVVRALQADRQENGLWYGEGLFEDDVIASAASLLALHGLARTLPGEPAEGTSTPPAARSGAQPEPSPPERAVPVTVPAEKVTVGVIRLAVPADSDKTIFRTLSQELLQAVSLSIRVQAAVPPAEKSYPAVYWLRGGDLLALPGDLAGDLPRLARKGTLLIVDARPGQDDQAFREVRQRLVRLFGPTAVRPLPEDHRLLKGNFAGGAGNDLRRVRFTDGLTRLRLQSQGPPQLWVIVQDGRLVGVASRWPLAASAAGDLQADQAGYHPTDAQRILLNLLLWAVGPS